MKILPLRNTNRMANCGPRRRKGRRILQKETENIPWGKCLYFLKKRGGGCSPPGKWKVWILGYKKEDTGKLYKRKRGQEEFTEKEKSKVVFLRGEDNPKRLKEEERR